MDNRVSKQDAVFAANALRAVVSRLRLKEDTDTAVERLERVATALEAGDTLLITDIRHLS